MEKEIEFYISKYSADLTRLCLSLCGNKADAEDLFQDTWYKAVKHYSKYDKEQPFDKWLYSICANTYKNTLKLFYNKHKVEFKTDEEKQSFLDSVPDANESNRDCYLDLHKVVSSLPKKLKIVIVLYYFKSYSTKEIAQILNIPEGTVKSRLYSAKKFIKGRLNYEEE